jgi:hypothetical protein
MSGSGPPPPSAAKREALPSPGPTPPSAAKREALLAKERLDTFLRMCATADPAHIDAFGDPSLYTATNEKGDNALLVACKAGNSRAAVLILRRCFESKQLIECVGRTNKEGKSAFVCAMERGLYGLASCLILAGTPLSPDVCRPFLGAPFSKSRDRMCASSLGVFIENFVKGDAAYDNVFMGLCKSNDEGMEEAAIVILDIQPTLYKTEIEHNTVLRVACSLKKSQLAMKILDLCPPNDSATKYINRPYEGRTALYFAVEFNLAEVEARLRSMGATTDLIIACERGDDPMARRTVEMNYDFTTGPGNGDTPLMLMIRNFVPTAAISVSFGVRAILNHIYTTLPRERLLRAINATVLSGPYKGQTALWLSCSRGKAWSDISCKLIERGANVNAKYRGMTPLMMCCTTLDFDTITSLFRQNADILQVNKDGTNAKTLLVATMTAKAEDPDFKLLKPGYDKALLQFSISKTRLETKIGGENAKAEGAKGGAGGGAKADAATVLFAADAAAASLAAEANAAAAKAKNAAAARLQREMDGRAKREAERIARAEAEAKAAANKAVANKAAANKAAANKAAANKAAANKADANRAAKEAKAAAAEARAAADRAAAEAKAAANRASAEAKAAANRAAAEARAAAAEADKAVLRERIGIVELMKAVEASRTIEPLEGIKPRILINGSAALRYYGETQGFPTASSVRARPDVDAFRITTSEEMCRLIPALVGNLEEYLKTKTPDQMGSRVPEPTGPGQRGIEISCRNSIKDHSPETVKVLDTLIASIGGFTETKEKDSHSWRREGAYPFNVLLLFEYGGRLLLTVRGEEPDGIRKVQSVNDVIEIPSFSSLVDLTFYYLDTPLRQKQLAYLRSFPTEPPESPYVSLPLLLSQQRDLEEFTKNPKGAHPNIVKAATKKVSDRTLLVNALFSRLPVETKALIMTLTTPMGGASRRKSHRRTRSHRRNLRNTRKARR